jgi:hypothetical protein
MENVEYFSYVGSLITGDATRTSEFKSRIATASAAVSKKKALFNQQRELKFRE